MHKSEKTVDLRNLTFRKLTVVRVPSNKERILLSLTNFLTKQSGTNAGLLC